MLSENNKKNIVNFIIGKCGKEQNTKNIANIYLNEDETYLYAYKYKVKVYTISSSNFHAATYEDETLY